MFTVTISSSIYMYYIFRKDLSQTADLTELNKINPNEYIENKKEMFISLFILFLIILLVLLREYIKNNF
jgi:Na+/H+ antiporter NhaD/arsenite permease-like protein